MNYDRQNNRSEAFIAALAGIYEKCRAEDFDPHKLNKEIMEAHLSFVVDKERFSEVAQYLEFSGTTQMSLPDSLIYGFRVKGKEIFLANLLNVLEEIEVPDEISWHFPDITKTEWKVAIGFATHVFLALQFIFLHDDYKD